MFIKLRKKSQITLPKSIVKKFRFQEGDIFDCLTYENKILLLPQNRNSFDHAAQKNTATPLSTTFFIPDADIYMQCFSRFCLYMHKKPVLLSTKASELLAFLASEYGGPIRKDSAASLLWADSTREQGLDNLLRLCKRIRKSHGSIPLGYDKKSVWIDVTHVACDLYEFEKLYHQRENMEDCEAALSLYRGLIFYNDCYDWTAQKEAYYDMRYLTLLSCMEDHMRRCGNDRAADLYRYYRNISE